MPPLSPLLSLRRPLTLSLLCRDQWTAEPAKRALPAGQEPEQFIWFGSLTEARKINTLSIINGIETRSKHILEAEWGGDKPTNLPSIALMPFNGRGQRTVVPDCSSSARSPGRRRPENLLWGSAELPGFINFGWLRHTELEREQLKRKASC